MPEKTREEMFIVVFERLSDLIRQINQTVQQVKRNDRSLSDHSVKVNAVNELNRQIKDIRDTIKELYGLDAPLSNNETAETLTYRRCSLIELNDQVQMLCHVIEHQLQIARTAIKEPLGSFGPAFREVLDQVRQLHKAILYIQLEGDIFENRGKEILTAKKTELDRLKGQIVQLEDKILKSQTENPGPLDINSRWGNMSHDYVHTVCSPVLQSRLRREAASMVSEIGQELVNKDRYVSYTVPALSRNHSSARHFEHYPG